MKTTIVIAFISVCSISICQTKNIDSLIAKLKNDSLKSIGSNPYFLEKTADGQIIDRRAIIFSMNEVYVELVSNGKEITPYLLKHLHEEDKDYAINLLLYSINKVDAFAIIEYASPLKISDWKTNRRDKDFIFWEEKFK